MKPSRVTTIAANIIFMLLWILCIVLIVPVLMSIPGKADAWSLALYLATLCTVLAYPVALPVLAFLEREARRRGLPLRAKSIRTMTWLASCCVMAIFTTVGVTYYAHEKARPVLTSAERFSKSYPNAILHRDIAWMDRLMAEGADVDHKLSGGMTAAIMSASFGQWSLVEFLLGRGADPDRTDENGASVRTLAAEPRNAATSPDDIQALVRVRKILHVD